MHGQQHIKILIDCSACFSWMFCKFILGALGFEVGALNTSLGKIRTMYYKMAN